MAPGQGFLPLRGETRCGYCGDPLTQQPGGDWACTWCRQFLPFITNVAEWKAFGRAAAKRKNR